MPEEMASLRRVIPLLCFVLAVPVINCAGHSPKLLLTTVHAGVTSGNIQSSVDKTSDTYGYVKDSGLNAGRNLRDKRTLGLALQSLLGIGVMRAPAWGTVMPAPTVGSKSNSTTMPTTTQPPEIDSNTIRYPFRPAQAIPFLTFAPLPPGVTVPYPPLLPWPTQPPTPAPSQTPKTPAAPCSCSSPALPSTPPTLIKIMPQMNMNGKPHLPVSGSTFDGHHVPDNYYLDEASDYDSDSQHNFNTFDHGNYVRGFDEYPTDENHDDELKSSKPFLSDYGHYIEYNDNDPDMEEVANLQKQMANKPGQSQRKSRMNQKLSPWADSKWLESHQNRNMVKFKGPSQFRIIIPPLLSRKRRDLFFDDAFKSFNLSSFDFFKIDPNEPPESTQSQFLEINENDRLVPSLDYRKKLEQDLEKYVESYVEGQISQGLVDPTKPKKTVIELKPKEGPTIKTVTTTVSKFIDGDKSLLESILDYSSSINPVPNPGELLHESNIDDGMNAESEMSKHVTKNQFDLFSWNSSR